MRRRDFLTLLGGAAAAWPLAARAQQPAGRVYRVGILETISQAKNARNLDALRRGLREQGYFEGQNLALVYRSVDGSALQFPALAVDLVQLGVDLLVTRGTPAAQAAKNATSKIPIVMAAIGEPLGTGVVASLARPGGNVTGLSTFGTELTGKHIEFMKEMLPTVQRIAWMQNMGNPVSDQQWEATKRASVALGLMVEPYDVRGAADIAVGFQTIAEHKINAVEIGIDAVTQENQNLIIGLANRYRIATVSGSREIVDAGGLASYGVSYPDLYYRAAGLIGKIFRGASPSDLPVEQPTKLEKVINLNTAKALGLTVPPTLLAIADDVIE
jgi:putative ABC transport system substrate-binding protein